VPEGSTFANSINPNHSTLIMEQYIQKLKVFFNLIMEMFYITLKKYRNNDA